MDRRTFVSLIPAGLLTPVAGAATPLDDRMRIGPEEVAVFGGPPGRRGGAFSLDIRQPVTFNPTLAEDSPSLTLALAVHGTLIGYDLAEQRDSDGVARSVTPSADCKTWTIELRKGIRWSDGAPFDAADVVFTFQAVFDRSLNLALTQSFAQQDGTLPKVEQLGRHTVRLTFAEPRPLASIDIGTAMLLPRHKLEAALKAGTFATSWGVGTPVSEIVGLGPFRIARYEQERRIVLERNYYYWKRDRAGTRLPYVDRVEYKIVPDQNATLLNFQGGATDLYDARPEDVELLEKDASRGRYTVRDLGPQLNMTYLGFNRMPTDGPAPCRGWFRKTEFRKAVSYAIDREQIVAEIYAGRATPVFSLTTPSVRGWYDQSAIVRYPHDKARARVLLESIGIEDRDGDGVAEDANGDRIEFTLMTNSNNPTRVAIASLIAEQLRAVGVLANVIVRPFPEIAAAVRGEGEYDAIIGGWQSAVPPDPILMRQILTSSGHIHPGYPNQPKPDTAWETKIDAHFAANVATSDMTERRRHYAEMLRIWSDELPEIDLVSAHAFLAARDGVKNLRPSRIAPFGAWNLDELYLEERRGAGSASPTVS